MVYKLSISDCVVSGSGKLSVDACTCTCTCTRTSNVALSVIMCVTLPIVGECMVNGKIIAKAAL